MSENITPLLTSSAALHEASDDGQLAARIFVQSLIENGDAMGCDEAGAVFSGAATDEIQAFLRSENKEAGIARLSGFLSYFGRVLWQETEPHRQAVRQVFETPAPPMKIARVIPIKEVRNGVSAAQGGDDGQ